MNHNDNGVVGMDSSVGGISQTPTASGYPQYSVGMTNSHNMTMPKNYSRYANSHNNLMGAGGSTGPSQNGDNM
jgi:hypothetical protein